MIGDQLLVDSIKACDGQVGEAADGRISQKSRVVRKEGQVERQERRRESLS